MAPRSKPFFGYFGGTRSSAFRVPRWTRNGSAFPLDAAGTDADLWRYFLRAAKAKGLHSIAITKVKGP